MQTSILSLKNDVVEPSESEKNKIQEQIQKTKGYNEQNDTYREKKDKVDPDLFINRNSVEEKEIKNKNLFYYYPADAIYLLNENISKLKIQDMYKDKKYNS